MIQKIKRPIISNTISSKLDYQKPNPNNKEFKKLRLIANLVIKSNPLIK